jgi:hypothetical protein
MNTKNSTKTAPAITIAAKPATGNGDLDGHEATCTCGWHVASSILSLAHEWSRDHLAWHSSKARA